MSATNASARATAAALRPTTASALADAVVSRRQVATSTGEKMPAFYLMTFLKTKKNNFLNDAGIIAGIIRDGVISVAALSATAVSATTGGGWRADLHLIYT